MASVWFPAGPRPFSALLLRPHASICLHFPSFFVFNGWIQCYRPSFVRFSPKMSSHYSKFWRSSDDISDYVNFTSTTIYVQPPRVFFLHRTSPTTTQPHKFSMIWKLRHIMLMKIRRVIPTGWRDVLSRLYWDGQICCTVVRRWLRPMYCGFNFLT